MSVCDYSRGSRRSFFVWSNDLGKDKGLLWFLVLGSLGFIGFYDSLLFFVCEAFSPHHTFLKIEPMVPYLLVMEHHDHINIRKYDQDMKTASLKLSTLRH